MPVSLKVPINMQGQETLLHCLQRTAPFLLLCLRFQKCQHEENWKFMKPLSDWVGSRAMTTTHNVRVYTTGVSTAMVPPGDSCLKKTNSFNSCAAIKTCWRNNPYSSLFSFQFLNPFSLLSEKASLRFLCQIYIPVTKLRLHWNLLACLEPLSCKKLRTVSSAAQ